jgi:hypothetical protein
MSASMMAIIGMLRAFLFFLRLAYGIWHPAHYYCIKDPKGEYDENDNQDKPA